MIAAAKPSERTATKPSEPDFQRLAALAKKHAGIDLSDDREEFLSARLSKRLSDLNLQTLKEYCDVLEAPGGASEIASFVESLTTHTTSFFREQNHFDWLRSEGLSALWARGAGKDRALTVWSAACSTGQELYSSMMALDDAAQNGFRSLNYRGIGTDISRQVLQRARNAVYTKIEISSIPEPIRHRYLLSSKKSNDIYRISQEIRQKTSWHIANIIDSKSIDNFKCDIVFMRNVLIYFDKSDQKRVVKSALDRLLPGGYLISGHSESSIIRDDAITQVHPTIHQKVR